MFSYSKGHLNLLSPHLFIQLLLRYQLALSLTDKPSYTLCSIIHFSTAQMKTQTPTSIWLSSVIPYS